MLFVGMFLINFNTLSVKCQDFMMLMNIASVIYVTLPVTKNDKALCIGPHNSSGCFLILLFRLSKPGCCLVIIILDWLTFYNGELNLPPPP